MPVRRWRGLMPPPGVLGHPLAGPLQLGGGGGGPALGHQTYPPGFLLHVLAMLSTSNLHPELAVQECGPFPSSMFNIG